jgi:hypothetical protein
MKALVAFTFTAALSAGSAYADCAYPAAPATLPDGRTATMEDMLAGQKAVKAYQKAIDDYVACIDKQLDADVAKGDLKPQQKTDMQKMEAQKHNAAVDQEQSVADRFNEQVKIYKARTDDKKN